MNKLLILGVAIVLAFSFVTPLIVAQETQDLDVTVNQVVSVSITPTTVDFGSVAPGSNNNAASPADITIDITGSNADVTVEVASVTGFPFANGLELDGSDPLVPTPLSWFFDCTPTAGVCVYTPGVSQTTTPTLDVPGGAAPGAQAGVITYTVAGAAP